MVENTLPAADTLAVSDKCTLVLERIADGKIRLTSNSLVEEKVVLPDQVLEARLLEGRIRIARKARTPDAGDPPREASTYDPYGPGETDDDLLVEEQVENLKANVAT